MVRISSTLLPTNASGVPQQEITNASIAITAAGTLNVSDSTAQTSLSNIESSVAGTLSVEDSVAQGTLSNIENSLTATLVVEDITAQASLADIVTAVQGTLSVSASVTINGSRTNLAAAASVSAGGFSSVVDVSAYTKNTVYIQSSTSDNIEIWWSPDGTNYYLRESVWGNLPASGGSNYYGTASFDNNVIHSIRLTYTAAATVTAGVVSRV
tara:strand:- start:3093 stop:3728 length:636 start_codon:yes stop_codon:yes gene_type:complete